MADETKVHLDVNKLPPAMRDELKRRLDYFSSHMTPELAKKLLALTQSAEEQTGGPT
jgi:hypothetical protein